ncbi:Type I restriction modification DNA specificity domain protein [uncultured archaeon]|nr:Type I restriction modification DNA specificity domain protein [uncultured archaeon]
MTKHFSILCWSEIAKWAPTASMLRYLYPNIPKDWRTMRVGDLVFQLREKHTLEPNKFYKLVGVKWYGGGVFCRENVKGSEISAKYLYPLIPNAFIYNRLFAWKESFAVVPETLSGYYVSNEFPQFSVDKQEIFPEFLCLIFLTKKVIKAVNSASVGSSAISRNRFSENEFLNFYVPVPPLQIQQAIMEYWKKAKSELAIQEAKIRSSVGELDLILQQQTYSYSKMKNSRFFIADFSKSLRWDVKSGRAAVFRTSNPDFVRLGDFAEECNEMIKPWEEPEKDWPVYGVNNEVGVFFNCLQKVKAFNVSLLCRLIVSN